MYTPGDRMYALEIVLEEAIAGWFGGEKGQEARRLNHLAEEDAACRRYVRRARPQKVGDGLFGTCCVGDSPWLRRRCRHTWWE